MWRDDVCHVLSLRWMANIVPQPFPRPLSSSRLMVGSTSANPPQHRPHYDVAPAVPLAHRRHRRADRQVHRRALRGPGHRHDLQRRAGGVGSRGGHRV